MVFPSNLKYLGDKDPSENHPLLLENQSVRLLHFFYRLDSSMARRKPAFVFLSILHLVFL